MANSTYKCIMTDGTIKSAKNIKEGDTLASDDFTVRVVMSVLKKQEHMYEIKDTYSHTSYRVGESHILSLKWSLPKLTNAKKEFKVTWEGKTKVFSCVLSSRCEAKNLAVEFMNNLKRHEILDISVKDYLELEKNTQKELKGYRLPLTFAKQKVKIDPYMLGYWLGDCCSIEKEVAEYFKNKIEKDKTSSGQNDFTTMIQEYDLVIVKHIPACYLCNNKKIRLSLLAGLIDANGILLNSKFEIFPKNTRLENDIIYLCRSLGLSITKYKTKLIIGGDITQIPVIVKKKKAPKQENKEDWLTYDIKIAPIEGNEYYSVATNGRYLLGDFTVSASL